MSDEKSLLEKFSEVLDRHRVEYVVIGGQEELLMGSPRVTADVDLCYRRTPENIASLASALKEIGVWLRGAPVGLPFVADARAISMGLNFTFDSAMGDLDLLGEVVPIGGFDAVVEHAETHAGFRTISLDDLIRVKRHINRPKDRESLLQLLAIKRVREETGLR